MQATCSPICLKKSAPSAGCCLPSLFSAAPSCDLSEFPGCPPKNCCHPAMNGGQAPIGGGGGGGGHEVPCRGPPKQPPLPGKPP